ncbi:MAG: phosphatase PAP2 family protein [Gemmatimonadota bacterium]
MVLLTMLAAPTGATAAWQDAAPVAAAASAATAAPAAHDDTGAPTPTGWRTPHDLLLGGIVVGSFLLIEPLAGLESEVNPDLDGRTAPFRRAARSIGKLQVGAVVTSATFLTGLAIRSPTVTRVGLHSLESVLVSQIAAEAIKVTVGRARPSQHAGPDSFEPFTTDREFHSFPSGHSTQAFALATTLSGELREEAPWLPFVLYPGATWVAITRVQDERHWITDVVAGAALGVLSANVLGRLNHSAAQSGGGPTVSLFRPEGGQGAGLLLTFSVR